MGNKVRIERICEFCGKTFIAKTCKTRFCCKACNDKYYKELIRSDRYNAVTKEVKNYSNESTGTFGVQKYAKP